MLILSDLRQIISYALGFPAGLGGSGASVGIHGGAQTIPSRSIQQSGPISSCDRCFIS